MESVMIFILIIIAMVMFFVLKVIKITKKQTYQGSGQYHQHNDELLAQLLERADKLNKRVQNLEEIVRR